MYATLAYTNAPVINDPKVRPWQDLLIHGERLGDSDDELWVQRSEPVDVLRGAEPSAVPGQQDGDMGVGEVRGVSLNVYVVYEGLLPGLRADTLRGVVWDDPAKGRGGRRDHAKLQRTTRFKKALPPGIHASRCFGDYMKHSRIELTEYGRKRHEGGMYTCAPAVG